MSDGDDDHSPFDLTSPNVLIEWRFGFSPEAPYATTARFTFVSSVEQAAAPASGGLPSFQLLVTADDCEELAKDFEHAAVTLRAMAQEAKRPH